MRIWRPQRRGQAFSESSSSTFWFWFGLWSECLVLLSQGRERGLWFLLLLLLLALAFAPSPSVFGRSKKAFFLGPPFREWASSSYPSDSISSFLGGPSSAASKKKRDPFCFLDHHHRLLAPFPASAAPSCLSVEEGVKRSKHRALLSPPQTKSGGRKNNSRYL